MYIYIYIYICYVYVFVHLQLRYLYASAYLTIAEAQWLCYQNSVVCRLMASPQMESCLRTKSQSPNIHLFVQPQSSSGSLFG